MRSSTRFGSSALRLFPWLALAMCLEATAIGFENGEVYANAESADGMTTSAAEVIDVRAVSPPVTVPPRPSYHAPARSSLNGTMSSVALKSEGSVSGALSQYVSMGGAQMDFVDNLFVNAPAVPVGTDLIVEVSWLVTGRADIESTPTIMSRSKVLLEADGFTLNPKPNDPPPPKQQRIRDRSNFTTDRLDRFGLVGFEYLVKAGTPVFDGNIRMRAVTGFICGAQGSIFSGNYQSSANAELNLTFIGATNVKTTDGRPLFQWTTAAQSGLNYGSRDDDPPSNPNFTVSPSSIGEKFVNLSWDSQPTEYYLVQASSDGMPWTSVTEVLGTGGAISIDVVQTQPDRTYRVLADFGTGNPSTTPRSPQLCILKHGAGGVRVAWPTNHWESYVLNEVNAAGNRSQLDSVEGTGSAVWFDFPANADQRLFQVEASLK